MAAQPNCVLKAGGAQVHSRLLVYSCLPAPQQATVQSCTAACCGRGMGIPAILLHGGAHRQIAKSFIPARTTTATRRPVGAAFPYAQPAGRAHRVGGARRADVPVLRVRDQGFWAGAMHVREQLPCRQSGRRPVCLLVSHFIASLLSSLLPPPPSPCSPISCRLVGTQLTARPGDAQRVLGVRQLPDTLERIQADRGSDG